MCPPLFLIVLCIFATIPGEGREHFCPQPPKKNNTKPSQGDCLANGQASCRVNDTLRYQCEEGYVRKAGTSGLIKCKLVNGRLEWQQAADGIVCICKGTTYDICPADSSRTPTVQPSECPEEHQAKATEGATLAHDASSPSQTTPTPTMHLSEPSVTVEVSSQTFPTMPSSEATLALEMDLSSLTTPALSQPMRVTSAKLPRRPPGKTQDSEVRTPGTSEGCGSTPVPGEILTPETVVTPARILSTKEKISIGAAGCLLMMIVAAAGLGIHLNHNRGVYARAGQDEPVRMTITSYSPTMPSA